MNLEFLIPAQTEFYKNASRSQTLKPSQEEGLEEPKESLVKERIRVIKKKTMRQHSTETRIPCTPGLGPVTARTRWMTSILLIHFCSF